MKKEHEKTVVDTPGNSSQMFICKCGAEREIVYFPELTQCRLCKRVGCWVSEEEVAKETVKRHSHNIHGW